MKLRQGSGKDRQEMVKCERPLSLNPCLELTLKLVATTTHHIAASSTKHLKIRLLNS